jgi:hypothetical protein
MHYSCDIRVSNNSVAGDSSLLGCAAVTIGQYMPTFSSVVISSSPGSNSPRKLYQTVLDYIRPSVISDFLRGVNWIFTLLGYYPALIGSYLPTFRDNLTVIIFFLFDP